MASKAPVPVQEIATSTVKILVASSTPARTNTGLQDLVGREFADDPTMVRISKCESRFRQFGRDGSVLRGVVNNLDVGLFQVNEKYHLAKAKELGLNIHTPEGNIKYAKYLRVKNGYNDWLASKYCWIA